MQIFQPKHCSLSSSSFQATSKYQQALRCLQALIQLPLQGTMHDARFGYIHHSFSSCLVLAQTHLMQRASIPGAALGYPSNGQVLFSLQTEGISGSTKVTALLEQSNWHPIFWDDLEHRLYSTTVANTSSHAQGPWRSLCTSSDYTFSGSLHKRKPKKFLLIKW